MSDDRGRWSVPRPGAGGGLVPGATTEIGPHDAVGAAADLRGTVRIAPAVLIELIELTVVGIPGVVGLQPRGRVERVWPRTGLGTGGQRTTSDGGGVANATPAAVYEAGGVRVRVQGDRIDADVSIAVGNDVNIMEVSRAIQRDVGVAAGRMLGMTVGDVNVYVADIEIDRDDAGDPKW